MNTKTRNLNAVLSFHVKALKTNFFFIILFGITLLLPNISKAQYDRVDYISGSTTGTTVSNVALTTKNTDANVVYSYFYTTGTTDIKAILVYNVPTGISSSTITRDTVLFIKSTDGSYPIYNVKTLRALSTFVMNDVCKSYTSSTTPTASTSSTDATTKNTYGKTFILTHDIVFTSTDLIWNWNSATAGTYTSNFLPIGGRTTEAPNTATNPNYNAVLNYFAGTFNGNGYIISGLRILQATSGNNFNGLFGHTRGVVTGTISDNNAAKIINLGITDCQITGGRSIGGICGVCDHTIINNCYVTNTSLTGNQLIGGIFGNRFQSSDGNYTNKLINCYSTAKVYSSSSSVQFGALIGLSNNNTTATTVTNCYYSSDWNSNITGTNNTLNIKGKLKTISEMTATDGSFVTLMNTNNGTTYRKATFTTGTYNGGYPILSLPNNTSSTPYNITSIADLKELSEYVMNNFNTTGRYFTLTTDLTFTSSDLTYDFDNDGTNESNFLPIGGWSNATTNAIGSCDFNGVFDGSNHIISGLTIKKSASTTSNNDYIGLFGVCAESAKISNLGLKNATLQGYQIIGGICGGSSYNIEHCFVTSSTITGYKTIGGICGSAKQVSNCYVTSTDLNGESNIGGLVAYNSSTVSNCYSTATITRSSGSGVSFGGLIGVTEGTLTNSYSIDSWNGSSIASPTGSNGTSTKTSTEMKDLSFVTLMNTNNAGIYKSDALFGTNHGYPIFSTQTATMTDPYIVEKGEEVIIPNGTTATIPTSITIEDGGSLIDNRATGNIYNGTTQVTLIKNLYVNKWNLFGIIKNGTATTATVTGVLNNNAGTTSGLIHDMSAVGYDYSATANGNRWNTTTYLGANAGEGYTNLTAGEGYFVWPLKETITISGSTVTNTGTNDETFTAVSQTGVPTNTDVSFNKQNNGTTAVNSGWWFALSNPYIGRLDIAQIISGNTQLQGRMIYTFNPAATTETEKWAPKSTGEIAPAQGFMVALATQNSTLNATIKASQQKGYSSGSKEATNNTIKPLDDMITFTCQANNTTKKAYANINEQATNGFDINDAFPMFSNNENLVEPYFLVENRQILKDEFKTMPYYAPMNFHASKESNTNLTVSNIPTDVNISIIDLADGQETVLENNSIFNFIANQGENEGRFVVKFAENNNVGIDNEVTNSKDNITLALYPNPATDHTILFIDNISSNTKVVLSDIQGRTIKNYNINKGQKTLKINTSNLASGIYYIRIITNNITKAEKLIVK